MADLLSLIQEGMAKNRSMSNNHVADSVARLLPGAGLMSVGFGADAAARKLVYTVSVRAPAGTSAALWDELREGLSRMEPFVDSILRLEQFYFEPVPAPQERIVTLQLPPTTDFSALVGAFAEFEVDASAQLFSSDSTTPSTTPGAGTGPSAQFQLRLSYNSVHTGITRSALSEAGDLELDFQLLHIQPGDAVTMMAAIRSLTLPLPPSALVRLRVSYVPPAGTAATTTTTTTTL
eukprot:gnl/Spiro4/4559_TR2271_c0_g1_i1.p1 gnl/Spiro4/4559_TR2271_c0_g1~~gnl/Spiro4/4559_TR2271_c0_g1_i1.p1  ORF type:complete len:244 (+),score=43.71 gnl/Spiro4/4559_TR2271_c0_g1_i1:28-732(+)